MNKKRTTCLLFAFAAFGLTAAQSETRPNVIVMLADDLGYADLGCQGSPDAKTPRIDSLAANGVRFTAGYITASQCSPSRAGLLSGRYQQRFGHESNNQFPMMLLEGGKTIADYLQPAGYATAHYGKWHIGYSDVGPAPEGGDPTLPTVNGFDESFGYPQYKAVAKKGTDIRPAPHAYDDRVFARKATEFMEKNKDRPFFIYLAFHAPHTQLVDFGGYAKNFPDAREKRRPVLSVMAQMDDAVGIVLDKLAELNQEENTLVFFLSDNGGTQRSEGENKHSTGSLNTPFSGDKGASLEGGLRVPYLVQWKGKIPAGEVYKHPVSSLDILPTSLAAAKVTPPADAGLDGVDLLPFIRGANTAKPHDFLFARRGAEQGVIAGNWKLVRTKQHEDREWRLINLSSDVQEEKDLAAQHPEKVKALLSRFEAWVETLPPRGEVYKKK